jgi:hypothetical protein
VQCAKGAIDAEIALGNLRSKCKGLTRRVFRKSTCGHTTGISGSKIVCLKESATGVPKCSIKGELACGPVGGVPITQNQCLGAAFCADQDKSGDFRVARKDLATGTIPSGDDAICVPACGDGIIDAGLGEECDDGVFANSDTAPDACRTDCTNFRCGDGVVDTPDTCDAGDGNNSDDPDAPSGCRLDCTPLRCGDGITDTGETCDAGVGNSDAPDAASGCRTDCSPLRCGDAVVDPGSGEACDTTSAAACVFPASNGCNDPNSAAPCTCSVCGDATIDFPLETCDPPGGACSSHCLLPALALYDTGTLVTSTSFTISKGLLGPGTALPIGPQAAVIPISVGPDLPGTGGVQLLAPLPTTFAPIDVIGAATACVFHIPLDPNDPNNPIPPPIPGASGIGWLDCVGGPANPALGAYGLPTGPDFDLYYDHCTAQVQSTDPNDAVYPGPVCDSNPLGPEDEIAGQLLCAPPAYVGAYSGGSGLSDTGVTGTGLCVPEQGAIDAPCALGTPDTFAGQFGQFGNAHGFQDPQAPECIGAGTGMVSTGAGIAAGDAFLFFNSALDVRGVTDPNDLNCVPPTRTPPSITPFTTGTAQSGVMDAFGSLAALQSQIGTGVRFTCPDILFGGPVEAGRSLFSTAALLDTTGVGPVPIDLNIGTSYISQ